MEFLFYVTDSNSEPVSGSPEYTSLAIRRSDDGYIYDWTLEDFDESADTPTTTLTESLSGLVGGLYSIEVETDNWSNGKYLSIFTFDDNTTKISTASEFIIYDGVEIDAYQQFATTKELLTAVQNPAYSSAASILLQEYYSNQDLDGDSLIFGKDFYIVDPPELLADVPFAGTRKTWSQYQSEHSELF